MEATHPKGTLSVLTNNSFELSLEYSIRHGNRHVFEDDLNESEYPEMVENAVERNSGPPELFPNRKIPHRIFPLPHLERFRSRFTKLPMDAVIDSIKGRADLVAVNSMNGRSYIFELKNRRNSVARKETKGRVWKILFERAVRQLNFYVTDDRFKQASGSS